MNRVYITEQLSRLSPAKRACAAGRRLKVYVRQLDMNFHLLNPSRRRVSYAAQLALWRSGIAFGWKDGATVYRRDVNLLELNLMMVATTTTAPEPPP